MVLSSAALVCLSAGVTAPAAAYAPSPSAQAQAGAGTPVCSPNSKDVSEISGLVAKPDGGYYAVQDSQPRPGKPKIFVLGDDCKLNKTINYPTAAVDPEDAALGKDGTLYIADIGDNDEQSGGSSKPRDAVAVWTMAPDSTSPVVNRLTYPDGKKHDAEALLMGGDGLPIIITKTSPVEVYVAESALVPNTAKGVKLKKAGDFKALQDTKTANPLGLLGWKLVTGAAASPDGSKVVVRTYSDAYEFDVAGGDVVKALLSGKPRITPLPNEAQGESITYTPDGKNYVTASDVNTSTKAPLLKYAPTDITVNANTNGGNVPSPKAKEQSFLQSLTLEDITYAVAAIGIVGLGLVIAGVVGIRRSRAARRAAGLTTGNVRGAGGADGDDEFAAVGAPGPGGPGGPAGGPGGPGGRGGPGGNVYGGGGPGRDGGSNVYGGGPGGGSGGQGGGSGGPGVYGGSGDRPGNRQGGGVYGGSGGPSGGPGGSGAPGGGGVYGGAGQGGSGGPARSGGGPGGGSGGGGSVYGGGPGDRRGGYGGGDQQGFAQGPPPRSGRGGYGPGDQGGYDRGYAPHR
ncbi:hypothetical protein GCM10018962_91510 [Dactylosporangium matsuzakiense]|uniref:Uncharacterized protein n=1 Tax=Dactylosporangium matsuzakiense TaxID=53360 RepID=A0A9W6NRW6_9ACTN|nr:hypothetical protein GCM10017581_083170 [Dactylosporangium matsuzakiense]